MAFPGPITSPVHDYILAHSYSNKRFLEPPRKAIPPPNLEFHQGKPSFAVANLAPFEYGNDSYGNPAFLQSIVASSDLRLDHAMLAWKYDMRRDAQYILPFLLLGPSTAARDVEFIKRAGVSFLIAVRSGSAARARPQFLNPAAFASGAGLQHLTVDLDNPYDLRRIIKPTVKAMNDHLEQTCHGSTISSHMDITGKILVFCESGNERSTTLVAAYLMVVFSVDFVTAIQMIQSQRFCIAPEDAMKEMLADLGAYLETERQVAVTAASNTDVSKRISPTNDLTPTGFVLTRPRKRTIENAFDSDEDMDDLVLGGGDMRNRNGVAPFEDKRA